MSDTTVGPLDLSDGDTSGFQPVPAGRYLSEIVEIKWDATKRDGACPAGTPMLKIQFKITNPEECNNRRLFTQYVNPPVGHDAKKAATMKGMLINFFTALGFKEEEVRAPGFNPDFEDLKGTECCVVASVEQKRDSAGDPIPDEYQNKVTGVKPASAYTASAGATSQLL